MKKVILVVLLVLTLNTKVSAKDYDVYYSKFSDFSEYSEEKLDSSELIEVETERRYRFYEEEIEGRNLVYDEGILKYQYYNPDDYYVTGYKACQYTKPEDRPYRIVNTDNDYKVKRLKTISGLVISDIEGSENLSDIKIYINDKEIDYSINNNELRINFTEPIYIQESIVKIDNLSDINSLTILGVNEENIYFSSKYVNDSSNIVTFTDEEFKLVNPEYEEEKYYEVKPDISNLDYLEVVTKYCYGDKYMFFYNINKKYIDGYFIEYEGYIRDELDYKDYYRYRKRDKVMVEREININSYDEKLEDYIMSSVDYKIDTNINYLENGTYSVSYITDFITLTKEVTVDIMENDLRKELDSIKENYSKLLNEYKLTESKVEVLEKNIKEKDGLINNLNEEINLNNQELLELKEENKFNNQKYNQLLNSYSNIDESYNNLLQENDNLSLLNEKYSQELIDLNLKNTDNEKKLKLSNQANDYLEKSLLNVKQESIDINNTNLLPFFILGISVFLVVVLVIKKLSHKN